MIIISFLKFVSKIQFCDHSMSPCSMKENRKWVPKKPGKVHGQSKVFNCSIWSLILASPNAWLQRESCWARLVADCDRGWNLQSDLLWRGKVHSSSLFPKIHHAVNALVKIINVVLFVSAWTNSKNSKILHSHLFMKVECAKASQITRPHLVVPGFWWGLKKVRKKLLFCSSSRLTSCQRKLDFLGWCSALLGSDGQSAWDQHWNQRLCRHWFFEKTPKQGSLIEVL